MYVKVCVPLPALFELKVLPITPGPLHVPPVGLAVNVLLSPLHILKSAIAVTVGIAETVTLLVSELVHPFAFVNVYVSVWVPTPALSGSKVLPLLIPLPDHVPPAGEADNTTSASSTHTLKSLPALTVGKPITVKVKFTVAVPLA